MPYATKQDLSARFGDEELIQLTDRELTGVIDDGVLDRALTDSAAEIDGYLGGRYQLPLVAVPPILVRIACDITRYLLYSDSPPENVKQRYLDAVKYLRDVSRGDVTLPDQSGAAPAPVGGPEHAGPERIFSQETLGDY